MAIGGVGVIITVVLIGFYLLYVVLPMFYPAQIEQKSQFPIPGGSEYATLILAMEEQHEIGMRLTEEGKIIFFNTDTGQIIRQARLPIDEKISVTAFAEAEPSSHIIAVGLSDGTALLSQHQYEVSYPRDRRFISPKVFYTLGKIPIQIAAPGIPIRLLAIQQDDEQATIAAYADDLSLKLINFTKETSLLSNETTDNRTDTEILISYQLTHIALDVDQRELYVADKEGYLAYYDVSNKASPRLIQRVRAVPDGTRITSLKFLSGGISILVGDSSGHITQWFPVRDEENNYTLQNIRHFDSQRAEIVAIAPEFFRKGFIVIDNDCKLGIYHTTAHRTVKLQDLNCGGLIQVAVAPRADAMLIEDKTGRLQFWDVQNYHPEISWQSIWGKVWYESRDKPEYIWQSSSASSDFEPKFSLTPLVYGTLKAAFYALLFAIPVSILGAMYTAYFMSAKMRSMVKPTIEIMEALPTVILGFLAGLWFAPFVENNMLGLFLLMLFIPLSILLVAYLWQRLPQAFRHIVPDGWEAAILIPVLLITASLAFTAGKPLELVLFNGNMPLWITIELGIGFDQRNSLVVGIAMGFAVIPTIFSISEDAIYSVPKHLISGSLALGATLWQTMIRVVLLTASPGIFSAVMIGMGRAVGETMIVLMATGNTPIMDMNIFEGFRALSANIAVEMPESEVNSTHYRILFLAGLVLFIATFIFNTVAETVRQRLRVKYSTL